MKWASSVICPMHGNNFAALMQAMHTRHCRTNTLCRVPRLEGLTATTVQQTNQPHLTLVVRLSRVAVPLLLPDNAVRAHGLFLGPAGSSHGLVRPIRARAVEVLANVSTVQSMICKDGIFVNIGGLRFIPCISCPSFTKLINSH